MKKWIENNRTIVIISSVILITMFFIFVVGKKAKAKRKQLLSGEIGGEVPEGWYPDDMAGRLFDIIDGIDSIEKKDAVAAAAMMLNDNQLIMVYNFWTDTYSTKTSWGFEFGTLTQAIRDEIGKGPELVKLLGRLEATPLSLP